LALESQTVAAEYLLTQAANFDYPLGKVIEIIAPSGFPD